MRPYLSLLIAPLLVATASADWRADADARIEKHRKGDFTLTITGPDGAPLPAANVSVRQTRSSFGFGTCVHSGMEADTPDWKKFREFVVEHFSMLVCENAMKWFDIEKERGQRDFAPADAIVKFAQENDLPLRGHCIAWEKTKWTRPWQHNLPPEELKKVLNEHIEAVAGRYKGKVIGWDVLNEVLNGEFYTGKFGEPIRPWFFKRVREVDPNAVLFTNEYAILAQPDRVERYVAFVKRLQELGAPVGGIGVQDHGVQRFYVPPPNAAPTTASAPATRPAWPRRNWGWDRPANPPQPPRQGPEEILKSLDRLGELNLPIHLTEISCITMDEELRARNLDMFLRVAFSHPKVEALILWGFWSKEAFKHSEQAMVDDNWNLTSAGKAVLNLIDNEWRTRLQAATDAQGQLAFRGFHGRYEVTATDAAGSPLRATVDLTAGKTSATAKLNAPPVK